MAAGTQKMVVSVRVIDAASGCSSAADAFVGNGLDECVILTRKAIKAEVK